ncbi:hypothetical protein LSUB1_G002537 [Lachnellula subtilissima]|uniref:Circumsporozoite protein n=1 Tax=Lachnellula subtilissima TaxID=602034 RepID=A0A8H8U9P6_9HELO|nr:hypothetical protein LSUB1_G002537 [Lachnellula subtilissima]
MYTQTVLIAFLAAIAEARFGQEQGNGAIAAIGALSDLGTSGQAATLSGGSIQFLLAAANPCGKLTQADQIVAELGTSDRAIAAARGLVAAEQNFNPFVVSIPSICSDPTLPTTAALRGVVPLIDPAVGGEAIENANSNTSIITPFAADGLSVAQVMAAQGFSNFTAVALDGTKAAAAVASGASSAASVPSSASVASSSAIACGATTMVTVTRTATSAASVSTASAVASSAASSSSSTAAAGAGAVTNAVTGNFAGFQASTIAGLDFGTCTPTMKFEAGLNGRKTTESTFQAIDPVVNKGQEEALNPAIITNRIHDQLTNVCGANQAAKDAAAAAQTQIVALGTRDATTADAWNTALGFAGTNTNPDNAPQTGLVGHT